MSSTIIFREDVHKTTKLYKKNNDLVHHYDIISPLHHVTCIRLVFYRVTSLKKFFNSVNKKRMRS